MKKRIIEQLEKPTSIEDLSSITSLSSNEVVKMLNEIEKEYVIGKYCSDDGIVRYYIDLKNKHSLVNIDSFSKTFRLLILSDSKINAQKFSIARTFNTIDR